MIPTKLQHRPDIDGLRAVAVLAVVLYHAGVPGFGGGFVGVDVFFVISGYLLTSIIAGELGRGEFSLMRFYERRVRRILPAFFVMLAGCAVVAPFLLLPDDYLRFLQSAMASVLFVSNLTFAVSQGYFAEIPSYDPLLHTWSLAVEEQFYIGLPLLLLALHRLSRRSILPVVALLALLSFAIGVWLLELRPNAAFYLTPGRAWELLAGSLLALRPLPGNHGPLGRALLSGTGLLLIAGSILLLSADVPFPGVNALYPCAGAVLVIHAGAGGTSLPSRLLQLRWLVFIGLVSYSLYLWHWPLLVFAEYYAIRELAPWETAGVLALSFLAAVLSWRFVERPFRQKRQGRLARLRPAGLFAAAGGVAAAFLLLGLADSGRVGAVDETARSAGASLEPDRERCLAGLRNRQARTVADVGTRDLCPLGDPDAALPSFILWGDSHAEALRPGVDAAARAAGVSGYFAGHVGCPPALGTVVYNMRAPNDCPGFNAAVMTLLEDPALSTVILHGRWPLYFHGKRYENELGADHVISPNGIAGNWDVLAGNMMRTLGELARLNKRVFIVAGIPEIGKDVPSVLARAEHLRRNVSIDLSQRDYARRNDDYIALFKTMTGSYPVEILYPDAFLCQDGPCRVTHAGRLLYVDDDHLSIAGARFLQPMLDPVFAGMETQSVLERTRREPTLVGAAPNDRSPLLWPPAGHE